MSKLNQIETKLKEMDQARFQKLCDQYLYCKGYDKINPLGVMIGADKTTKGTPDTLIMLPNGKYIFAEYTTQKTGIYDKFLEDLAKCFDEAKTGIPVEKIEKIILCHNSPRLATEEINGLTEKCQQHECDLDLIGIGPLSHNLYQKFPGLVRDFLGIEVDTGQIISPSEFIASYNKSALATPLDTTFRFRENEMKQILEALEIHDLVIVAGKAGVGKSRLALEAIRSFTQSHTEFETKCIFNRAVDLFEDLRVYFTPPGHHFIFVDDANRVSGFEYILQLLHDQNQERKIKIVVTVRDYALDKVREKAAPYGGGAEVAIDALTNEQIKELVSEEYEIRNHLYLDRISDTARGNPRLAIMAARVAKRENTLQSINDVSALYDEYFSTIRQELTDLQDKNLLKVAGITAFIRAVDRSNEHLMATIKDAFGIAPEDFWAGAQRLHELEVLDMYEDEVVRVSDQVLATYFFYLAFFKERVLSFAILLDNFFPQFRHRIVDALNPLLSAFDSKALSEQMRQHVTDAWGRLERAGREEDLLLFMHLFWFLKETDVLLYLHERISTLKPVPELELNFKSNGNVHSPSILSLLSALRYVSKDSFRMVIELLLEYLAKCPKDLPYVLHLLMEDFGYRPLSHHDGFEIEKTVMDVLWKRAQEDSSDLFKQVYLAVAEYNLRTHFTHHEAKERHAISIIQFDLPATTELFELRQAIWQGLFTLYQSPNLREKILGVLHSYCLSGYYINKESIIKFDSEQVLPFIEAELDAERYDHCLVAQAYFQFLKQRKISFDENLQARLRNETYTISELLLVDRSERKEVGWQEYEELKVQEIKTFFASYTLDDYKRFFAQCDIIKAQLRHGHDDYVFQGRVVTVLFALADTKPDLFVQVLDQYLACGNPLALNPNGIVAKLTEVSKAEQAYELLACHEYREKARWLFAFFEVLPPDKVQPNHLSQLYDLYQTAEWGDQPRITDFLIKYLPFDKNAFIRVTEIVTEKAQRDSRYGYCLTNLFNPYTDACKGLHDFFAEGIAVLKKAYFAAQEVKDHSDFDGTAFNAILDLDPNFAKEYVEWLYRTNEQPSHFDDSREYEFIWKRDDYEELITGLIERLYEIEKEKELLWYSYLAVFFQRNGERPIDDEVEERQNQLLSKLIEQSHQDSDFVRFVFGVISNFSYGRRKSFVAHFLKRNRQVEDFKRLQLEPSFCSWAGSEVPMLQAQLDFYESLLPLLNTVDLLKHRQHVENVIQDIRENIKRAKKHDFIDD